MSILFHKDYPYLDLDNCYKNFDLLVDSQQWVKNKNTRLNRKMERCFPRGKAYMRVRYYEFMAGN